MSHDYECTDYFYYEAGTDSCRCVLQERDCSADLGTIKFLKGLNKIGFLKSQKPLSVSLLAKKMIIESKSEKSVQLKTYQLKDIL